MLNKIAIFPKSEITKGTLYHLLVHQTTAGGLMMDTSALHPAVCSHNNGGEIFFSTWDQHFLGTDDHLIWSRVESHSTEWIGFC